jgi:hypothetical protein
VRLRPIALLLAAGSCSPARPPMPGEVSPGVVFPHHVAEGRGDDAPAELPLPTPGSPGSSSAPASSAAPAGSGETPASTSDPPDPVPLRQLEQYEYSFRYEDGAVHLLGVRAVRFKQPVVTARRIGRFAFELWIGHELVDRVRFDFPLLGGDEPQTGARPLNGPPSLASGAYNTKVLIPASARARTARLVDRATRGTVELPWPPEPKAIALTPPAASAAGKPAPAPPKPAAAPRKP